jgi:hypothetical protein
MARVAEGTLKNWQDTEVVHAYDYKMEREVLRVAINDNYDKLLERYTKTEIDGLLALLKGAGYLDTTTLASLQSHANSVDTSLANRYTKQETDTLLTDVKGANRDNTTTLESLQKHANQTDLALDRRYEKDEVESRLETKTNITGDHKGTWMGVSLGEAAEAINGGRLDVVETLLKAMNTTPVNLTLGENTVSDVPQKTPIEFKTLTGRSLINLLGNTGRMERISPFLVGGMETSLVGFEGADTVLQNTVTGTSYVAKDFPQLTTGKYYIALADVFVTRYVSNNVKIYAWDHGGFTNPTTPVLGSSMADGKVSTEPQTIFVAGQGRAGGVRISIGTHSSGANLDYKVGNFRVFEISSTDFTKINAIPVEELTKEMYHYVDGIAAIMNPSITLGNQRKTIPHTLHGFGLVRDRIFPDVTGVGNPKLMKYWQEITLDYRLAYTFNSSATGMKAVKLAKPIQGHRVGTAFGSRHDGVPITNSSNINIPDRIFDGGADTYITIPQSDSGWGDSYTPSPAEIKAYFMGWKMNNGTFGQPYNGSGTKTWHPWYVSVGVTPGRTTVPDAPVDDAFPGYKIIYQLVNPITTDVEALGSVVLSEGENNLTLNQGVIENETAYPSYDQYAKTWRIAINDVTIYNVSGDGWSSYVKGNALKFKNSQILEIYKNGVPDKDWTIQSSSSAYGDQLASIPEHLYDPSAFYTVSYVVRPEYTAKISNAGFEYSVSIRSLLEKITDTVANHERQLDSLSSQYVTRKQQDWLPLVLRNGARYYTNGGGYSERVEYRITEWGEVQFRGLVVGVPDGTLFATLPPGAVPRNTQLFPVVRDTSTNGKIQVNSSGNMTAIAGSNVYVDLSNIRYSVY